MLPPATRFETVCAALQRCAKRMREVGTAMRKAHGTNALSTPSASLQIGTSALILLLRAPPYGLPLLDL